MAPSSTCLDEETALSYIRGPTSGTARADIDEHLADCDRCRRLVSELVQTETHPPAAAQQRIARGSLLGRYVVLDPIGAGSMGTVYGAYDPKLDRRIAIKIIRRVVVSDSTESRARMMRESQILARISHPNVIAIYDVGEFEDAVFIAMELVEGPPLSKWLKAQPRTLREIVDVFVQAGLGLDAAHAVGVVHRDFKPDNVLVGNDGRVRVTDFGLAKPTNEIEPLLAAAGDRPSLLVSATRSGVRSGTPAYMSPEQHGINPVDARTDQFAFCVSFYEALYGRRPYEESSVKDVSYPIVAGLTAAAPAGACAPSKRIPASIRRALERGLQVDPGARHPSMKVLVDVLERDARVSKRSRAQLVVLAGLIGTVASGTIGYRQYWNHRMYSCSDTRILANNWSEPQKARLRQALLNGKQPTAERDWARLQRTLNLFFDGWSTLHQETCASSTEDSDRAKEVSRLRLQCLGNRLREVMSLLDLAESADPRGIDRLLSVIDQTTNLSECETLGSLTISDPISGTNLGEDMGRCPLRGPTQPLDEYLESGSNIVFEGWFCSRKFPNLRGRLGDDVLVFAKLGPPAEPPKLFAVSRCVNGCKDEVNTPPAHCQPPPGGGCSGAGWYCGSLLGLDPKSLYTCYPSGGVHLVQRCAAECKVNPPGCADECP